MNLPEAIRTTRWMVRDTMRQAVATKLFWVMIGTTIISTMFCLSVDVQNDTPTRGASWDTHPIMPKSEADKLDPKKLENDGVRVITGEITLGFGMMKVPIGRNREDSVRQLELLLVGLVADTAGVLLALLWTAGFLPTFLEPQSATVLLAKPAPRWSILLGKYLGVVLFVGLNAALFIGGTWLALGIKTGVWFAAYWLAVPLLVINFGIFYAVSAFFAVWTRSTVASAFGTLLFWFLCWMMNYTHHRLTAFPIEGMTATSHLLLDMGYWLLPKPLDLGGIFYDAMYSDGFLVKSEELRLVQEAGRFRPELSVLASSAFAAGTLALTAYEFEMTDY